MRSFFKELGLLEEPSKRHDRETDKDVPDVFVYFSGSAAHKRAKQAVDEEAYQEGQAAGYEYGEEY